MRLRGTLDPAARKDTDRRARLATPIGQTGATRDPVAYRHPHPHYTIAQNGTGGC